ncbi:MAG: hypothetical protein J5746_14055, partial [Victivallales bacterium]|nr:hypothetical protein [Victivallales bacterium]
MNDKIHDVSIICRHDNGAPIARKLQLALADRGLKVFFEMGETNDGKFNEPYAKRGGDPCSEISPSDILCKTREAIGQSRIVLFLMTEGVLDCCINEDNQIRAELEFVMRRGIPLVPIIPTDSIISYPRHLPHLLEQIKNIGAYELNLKKSKSFNESVDKIFH